jgi:hypothetical protein
MCMYIFIKGYAHMCINIRSDIPENKNKRIQVTSDMTTTRTKDYDPRGNGEGIVQIFKEKFRCATVWEI